MINLVIESRFVSGASTVYQEFHHSEVEFTLHFVVDPSAPSFQKQPVYQNGLNWLHLLLLDVSSCLIGSCVEWVLFFLKEFSWTFEFQNVLRKCSFCIATVLMLFGTRILSWDVVCTSLALECLN